MDLPTDRGRAPTQLGGDRPHGEPGEDPIGDQDRSASLKNRSDPGGAWPRIGA
jgi:hypothetical protein